jgi:hypothetical protein
MEAGEVTMATEQVTVTKESLYEGFRRDAMIASVLLAGAWLWAVFSFFTSTSAGTWFARSGSVMCLVGAAATFKLINDYNRAIATAVEHGITMSRRVELVFDPPKLYQSVQYWGYLTGIVGTLIWGYGDILVRIRPY